MTDTRYLPTNIAQLILNYVGEKNLKRPDPWLCTRKMATFVCMVSYINARCSFTENKNNTKKLYQYQLSKETWESTYFVIHNKDDLESFSNAYYSWRRNKRNATNEELFPGIAYHAYHSQTATNTNSTCVAFGTTAPSDAFNPNPVEINCCRFLTGCHLPLNGLVCLLVAPFTICVDLYNRNLYNRNDKSPSVVRVPLQILSDGEPKSQKMED